MANRATFSCSSIAGNGSWSADVAIDQLLRSAGRIRKSNWPTAPPSAAAR
ncbi:hypothetical protein ACU063_23710 [Paenibacillus sp. M.A.Huq-81]